MKMVARHIARDVETSIIARSGRRFSYVLKIAWRAAITRLVSALARHLRARIARRALIVGAASTREIKHQNSIAKQP